MAISDNHVDVLKGNIIQHRRVKKTEKNLFPDIKQEEKNMDVMSIQDDADAVEKIKQDIADKKGVAVTSSEDAADIEKASQKVIEKKGTENAVEEVCDEMNDDVVQKERNHQIMLLETRKNELIAKLDVEIAKEKERAKVLTALERSRKNAIDSARALYGSRADIRSIQRSYDQAVRNIDPRADSLTDRISVGLDNALGGNTVRMLMPNGSVKNIDADVALILNDKTYFQSYITDEVQNIEDFKMQIEAYASEINSKVDELESVMESNRDLQDSFRTHDPYDRYSEEYAVRQERLRKLGLPDVDEAYEM